MEKLLQWHFTIHHISGEKNAIPDDLSRFPWTGMATMGPSSQEEEDVVSWPSLRVASKADEEIQEVYRLM